ncbi:hypothetical protein PYW08_000812 [Mythimna loreyi]|uniref:Uncharacterized protein n=1 Tax=Mythimna loreyi TaxID=667449 RepID=A0ACC2QYL0_9NEOP|nr:hypothetical protein PYW08_000812 [Mythimna loreyi]
MPMTRSAYARQEEAKLSLALSELKASREYCDRLNKEIDDSEKILLEAHVNNKKLRNQMSQLHIQLTDVIEDRDRLQLVVDGFSQCSTEYEHALSDKYQLQQQLLEAKNQISELETTNLNITASLNHSLFSELVPIAPSMVQQMNPSCTIDLISDDDSQLNKTVRVVASSKNKLKKYIKINKFIVKTKKMVKKQKFFIKNVKLNRERLHLLNQLDLYSSNLEKSTRKYQNDTQDLQKELNRLQNKLSSMTIKYTASENQMREYVLAMNELVSSQKTNCEHCEPPSIASEPDHSSTICDLTQSSNSLPVEISDFLSQQTINKEIVVFCDEIGKGLGHLLTNEYPGHSIINNCMPGCSLFDIMKKIIKCKFHQDTVLLILVGNRGHVSKGELLQYYGTLSNLSVKKIVMFTFPYSQSLPQEENLIRYKTNVTLHNLTINNSLFHLIDTNNYVGTHFYLTKDRYLVNRYYLSKFCRRQIAMSLSYYFLITAKNLAKQIAPIEQCLDISSDFANNLASNVDININLN